jgi:hypothetical protein
MLPRTGAPEKWLGDLKQIFAVFRENFAWMVMSVSERRIGTIVLRLRIESSLGRY